MGLERKKKKKYFLVYHVRYHRSVAAAVGPDAE